jgi:hypothetical protein
MFKMARMLPFAATLLALSGVSMANAGTSQAAFPHWYDEEVLIPEGSGVEAKTYSPALTFKVSASPKYSVTCVLRDFGQVLNPAPGFGAGRDESKEFTYSECKVSEFVPVSCTAIVLGTAAWKGELEAGSPIHDRVTLNGIEILMGSLCGTRSLQAYKYSGTLKATLLNGPLNTEVGCKEKQDTRDVYSSASGVLKDSAGEEAVVEGMDCIWGLPGGFIISALEPPGGRDGVLPSRAATVRGHQRRAPDLAARCLRQLGDEPDDPARVLVGLALDVLIQRAPDPPMNWPRRA